jgi:hypothetical protein
VRETATGTIWQWFPDEGGHLGELGFWGAIIAAATNITSSIIGSRGGGSKKELEQAAQIIQQQQAQIAALQAQPKKSAGINLKKFMKKNGVILIAGLAAYMLFIRK